jgi:hypothetical protein
LYCLLPTGRGYFCISLSHLLKTPLFIRTWLPVWIRRIDDIEFFILIRPTSRAAAAGYRRFCSLQPHPTLFLPHSREITLVHPGPKVFLSSLSTPYRIASHRIALRPTISLVAFPFHEIVPGNLLQPPR